MAQPQVHTLNTKNFEDFVANQGIGEDQQISFIAPLTAHILGEDLMAASQSARCR